MLHRTLRNWAHYTGNLFRTSDYFILEQTRNNVLHLNCSRTCPFRLNRKLSSVSKIVFDSKSENSNRQSTDSNEETSPLHDMELQNFLEEIKKDFDEQPAKKQPTGIEYQDTESKSDDTGTKSDANKTKFHKLSADEYANLPLSIKERFEQYRDEDSNVIPSAEETVEQLSSWKQRVIQVEEEQEQYLYQKKSNRLDHFSLERGKHGVFDIEQLVTILKQENMHDITVIKIPPSLHYCDFMALATAKSPRHLFAVAEFIRRLHKKMKCIEEPFLKIEGENCRDWKAIDIGHIVLHLFLPDARELYDIETLWTVGEKYDPLSNQKADPYENLLEEHMKFLKDAEPLLDIK